MKKDFEFYQKKIISPLDKPEFIDNLFKVCYCGGLETYFSQVFDYDLNPKKLEIPYFIKANYNFMKLKTVILCRNLKNVTPENKELKNMLKYCDLTLPEMLKTIKITNQISEDALYKFARNSDGTPELLNALHNYKKIDKCFLCSGWFYFKSHALKPGDKNCITQKDIKYRIYMSINRGCLEHFTYNLIKKFDEKNIPYNLKILETLRHLRQNDTFVAYVDTKERIAQYINVIESVLIENPEFLKEIHDVPSHLFSVTDKIGVGIEPLKTRGSYSSLLGNITYELKFNIINEIHKEFASGSSIDRDYRRGVIKDYDHFINLETDAEKNAFFTKKVLEKDVYGRNTIYRDEFEEKFFARFPSIFEDNFEHDVYDLHNVGEDLSRDSLSKKL